jgi:hypothetical protein
MNCEEFRHFNQKDNSNNNGYEYKFMAIIHRSKIEIYKDRRKIVLL